MVVAIIQARIGSTRLPGKVLKKVAGRPLLEYMIERAKKAKTLDAIILATTIKKEDAKLSQIAKRQKIDFFQGSEADVLDRYYQAATRARAAIFTAKLFVMSAFWRDTEQSKFSRQSEAVTARKTVGMAKMARIWSFLFRLVPLSPTWPLVERLSF